ncbi:uncharacterized protein PAC_10582 [Phialocephala subalpina]|uniref:Uncharacterized protein n=1 Tax=Phialocephala subalpina TaxID=576137 RepID=A0A1L7X6P2_9HELO|nr:uncharacterized protein PAC_10582 [Phialocephala subalpina]
MNSSETISSSSPAPAMSQVPWQAAVLVLFIAAANCMLQPAGRVCGASSKYTVYLRSSPLVCFADALTLPMHLIKDRWKKKLPVRESIKSIVQRRFQDEHSAIQRSRFLQWSWTLFRWAFFLVSVLPVMRFSVESGVLWTKGWIGMFLHSWLITEILNIVSWCLAARSAILSTSIKSDMENLLPSSRIDTETLYFATFTQVIFLLIILRDLWHPATGADQFDHLCDSSWEVNGGLWFLLLTAVTMSGIIGGPKALGKPSENENKEDDKKSYSLLYEICFRGGMLVLETGGIWALGYLVGYKVFIIDLLAWTVITGSVFTSFVAIGGVVSPLLGEKRMQGLGLEQVVEGKDGEKSDVDFGGTAAFLMMVYTGVISVVWFVFVYGEGKVGSP